MSETLDRATAAVEIDPRAVVEPGARLGAGVRIGAYAVVGEGVELGDGCILHPHAVVNGPARLGRGNVLHPFCRIGGDPQDLKYAGERTRLEIGDRNVFRECVTMSRGTMQGGGVTRIGSDNLFMASAHVAHDCLVGNHTIFANGATLAGHVTVEDYSTIGAFSPVHQFCRIGRHAYIGASTVITQDVPPFSLVVTQRHTRCFGVNSVGLERRGFTTERIRAIESAYRLLLNSKLNTSQAFEQMRLTLNGSADVAELMRFMESSERGVTK
jgi:UDP-N-acetylglucosamine acyltransferase